MAAGAPTAPVVFPVVVVLKHALALIRCPTAGPVVPEHLPKVVTLKLALLPMWTWITRIALPVILVPSLQVVQTMRPALLSVGPL